MRHGRLATLVGIDVGGSFTDAVAVRAGEVVGTAKTPTDANDLARSLLGALDMATVGISPGEIARIGLSTTLITNLLAQQLAPPVAILLIPGPGLSPEHYRLGSRFWSVDGATNFRGRETAPLDRAQVMSALKEIQAAGYRRLGVVGKFSPRNPEHEERIVRWAEQLDATWKLCAGHTISGQLNFPRRAAATGLTLAVGDAYRQFFRQLQDALASRGLTCPIVVLKGDGGTLPLGASERAPLQSIFSGPAASAMGVMALRPEDTASIVVDVGGTTTDLALILDSGPLFSSRGGSLNGIFLPTRAFATRSLPVGGDSPVILQKGRVSLGKRRQGVAFCLGGPVATLTDALRLLGHTEVGDADLAHTALKGVAGQAGTEAVETASLVVENALARIEAGITGMFESWQREPVYRIWELKQKGAKRPDTIVGVGAAAPSLIPALAERMGARALIPPYAAVANALGAALARTTFTTTLHLDTERGRIEIAEEGLSEPLPGRPRRIEYTMADAERMAREWMSQRGTDLGVAEPLADCETVLAEQFNIVEGWQTVGRIFDVCLERGCGLVEEWDRALLAHGGDSR